MTLAKLIWLIILTFTVEIEICVDIIQIFLPKSSFLTYIRTFRS